MIDQTDDRPQLYTRNAVAAEREDHGCLRDESRSYDRRVGDEREGTARSWGMNRGAD